jgi:ATP-dependent exoDNAse (exonuclease V) beta subunit
MLVAQLLLVFQRYGEVDHSQVAQSALLALGDDDAPTELALRLDYQIEHILVDEFQDTAITQYELLHKLTRGWGEHNELNPDAPRTLMIVGDAMQSIYGFRGANVGLFLKARREGFNGVVPQFLQLRCNFRSEGGVVDWVNETFAQAFPTHDDVYRSQVSYSPAIAVRQARSESAVSMHAFQGYDARNQEVAFLCEYIANCHANGNGTMAILGRSRKHLQPIIRRLKQMRIAYNAPDLDALAQSPVVADLLTLCRALGSDADRLAWMALLRAPWCGLSLQDLLCVAHFGDAPSDTPVWSVLQDRALQKSLSDDGRIRLAHIIPALYEARIKRDRLSLRVWVEQAWRALGGPQCAPDVESLLDAENFFQLLEQAEVDGAGLDLEWLNLKLQNRFTHAGDPDSNIHLLTLHKAKGLEFGQVIIPQLDRLPRRDGRDILLWDEHSTADGIRSFFLAADDHSAADAPTLYNYLQLQARRKALLEATRLLYVGATRAISRLMLTAAITMDTKTSLPRDPPALSLLKPIWETFRQQMTVQREVVVSPTVQHGQAQRLVTRLRRSTPPVSHAAPGKFPATEYNPVSQLANHRDRSTGNVVHQALDELSRSTPLPQTASDAHRQRWRRALQREGLQGAALDAATQAVFSSVTESLRAGGSGRWLLSSEHSQAHSEWPLTTVDTQGRIRDIVIDRSFIDAATGVRWVIDYKTSSPAPGEALDTFIQRESAVYYEQLRSYRDAVRLLGHEPLRCALFFAVFGHLHVLEGLDLPNLDTGATRWDD